MAEVWLLGFRGATRASYRTFAAADPHLYAGHVGPSLDRGATIYGFSPLAPGAPPRGIIDRLRRGDTFPDVVRDDRSVFERAVAAADQGLICSPVSVWARALDAPTLEQVQARLQAELRDRAGY